MDAQKRRETMLKKYGGEEGLRQYYQDLQKLSRLHPNNQKGSHRGGFSDPDLAREAGRIGGRISRRARTKKPSNDSM